MTNTDFVKRVEAIAATNPTYRTGGDGSDGTCDCIGLIMGALGEEYPMHSTNYFARYELAIEPAAITEETEPELGDLVFKARGETNPRYDLHERYKPGGRYYINGDLLDYYHVGVVTSTDPLTITHCTETGMINGIARDYTLDGWTHIGMVDGMEYPGADWFDEEEPAGKKTALVVADSGFTVNMRQKPSKAAPIVLVVPIGSRVEVQEKAQGWATVVFNGVRGYMMTEFLQEDEPVQDVPAGQGIIIPYELAAALFEALKEAGF